MKRLWLLLAILGLGVAWYLRGDGPAPADAAAPGAEAMARPPLPEPGPDALARPVEEPRVPADSGAALAAAQPVVQLELIEWHGRTAAGAPVALVPADGPLVVARTDNAGRVAFDGTIDGGVLFVRREAAPAWRSPEPLGRGEHRIALPAGTELSGRLLVDGSPPREALRLRLSQRNRAFFEGIDKQALPEVLRVLEAPEVLTAAHHGGFRFLGLLPDAPGSLQLPFGWRLRGGSRVYGFGQPATGLDLELERELIGRVLDESTGLPVPEADVQVRLTRRGGGVSGSMPRTDANGLFASQGASPETLERIEITIADAVTGRGASATFERERIPEDLDVGDILVRSLGSLRFRAVTAAGEPIEGVVGKVEQDAPPFSGGPQTPPSDKSGVSTFAGVPAEAKGLRFVREGFRLARAGVPPAGTEEIEVVLERCNRLEILAHGPREALEMCSLFVVSERGLTRGSHFEFPDHHRRGPLREMSSGGTPDGRSWRRFPAPVEEPLVLEDLGPVAFTLELRDPANGLLHLEPVAPLGREEERRIEIPWPVEVGRVRVRVVGADGAGVSGASVAIHLDVPFGFGYWRGAQLRPDGVYELGPLREARVDLSVKAPGHGPRVVRQVDTRNDLEILVALERAIELQVSARDAHGILLEGGSLSVRGDDGARLMAQPTGTGKWTVADAPPGPLRATLRLAGREYEREHDAGHGPLIFELPAHGRLVCSWSSTSDARAELHLRCELAGIDFRAGGGPLARGRVEIPALLPGTYRVSLVQAADAGEWRELGAPVTVVVEAGKAENLDLGRR